MTTALASRVAKLEKTNAGLSTASTADTTPLFAPNPGPQARAYESHADITGYGGAAGGGKSMLAIGLAVTRHRRSIIFRREAEQVRDLWDKLGRTCGIHGRSNENLLVWRGLPGGRWVRLAGVKNEGDWRKYQGHAHDLYAFDEATEFSEAQVRTLIAWNRTEVPGQRCRVVLAFNPPTTTEGEWIIDFFAPWLDETHANPAEPGELRWYAVVDGQGIEREDGFPFEYKGETITPLSRTFFPARLDDNPYLAETGYRATLQNVPEPLRSQLLYSDFTIGLADDEWQVIPTGWVREAQDRWTPDGGRGKPVTALGIDLAQGGADQTVIVRRHGHWFSLPETIPGREVPEANVNAEHVKRALAWGGVANIDADGIGAATFYLVQATHLALVHAYHGGAATDVTDASGVLSFQNVRAAAYWRLREALDPSSIDPVALPPGRELRAELCAARYIPEGNTIKLEKKEHIKQRLGRSPDLADAVVMALRDDPRALRASLYGLRSGPIRR